MQVKDKEKTKEKTIECGWFEIFIKLFYKAFCFCLKFCVYLIISFLQMLIDFIYSLLDFDNFSIVKRRNVKIEVEEKDTIESLTKHVYTFQRSELYDENYNDIKKILEDFSENNVAMNHEISNDILKKIAILTVETEKKALAEGYAYASFTKYRFADEEEIYSNFLEYKVMRGEGSWQD